MPAAAVTASAAQSTATYTVAEPRSAAPCGLSRWGRSRHAIRALHGGGRVGRDVDPGQAGQHPRGWADHRADRDPYDTALAADDDLCSTRCRLDSCPAGGARVLAARQTTG